MSVIPTDSSVIITPRAVAGVARGQPVSRNSSADVLLRKAINDGDKIGQNDPPAGTHVSRRALIIAPEYRDLPSGQLDGPPADAGMIYSMLVDLFQYDPKHIRVLCDVPGTADNSRPTKKNILESLDWLTRASDITGAGDYRFLHYSGHGLHVLSNEDNGKQLRRPGIDQWGDEQWDPAIKPRDGDTERSPTQIDAERIKKVTVLIQDLGYYQQGIYAVNIDGAPKEKDNIIYDKTLNSYLSKLPPGAIMNCVIDCCESGRIFNLRTKVAGAGFRAAEVGDGRDDVPESQKTPAQLWSDEGKAIQQSELALAGNDDSKGTSSEEVAKAGSTPPRRIYSKMLAAVGLGTPQVTLSEDLPQKEKDMDASTPDVVRAWTAAHSRQEAWDTGYYGEFTHAFVTNCRKLKKADSSRPFNHRNLWEDVSADVTHGRKSGNLLLPDGPNPQFVQLWAHLADETSSGKDDLLNSDVVL